MILKGGSRRGANDLALHLTNEVDNERVVIAEVRGMVADNLYDGFREWELICDQTQAKEPFYSLSINPDPNQREWSEAEWQRAIAHIEDRLGLSGQPRAVIFHEKEGEDGKIRRHAHVVWSRIKFENGKFKAVHMGQDYYKLKTCARELAKEFGIDLPKGIKTDSLPAREKNDEVVHYDLAKSHGKGRDPISAADRKKHITKIWHESEGAEAFCEALRRAGYVVAQGERRAFVVVDQESGIHALARQIAGVSIKEVKHRLGNADAYPSIEQAMDEIRICAKDASCIKGDTSKQRVDLSKEQRLLQKLRRMAQRANQLNASRQAKLGKERIEIAERHKQERQALQRQLRAKETKVLRVRHKKKPEGIAMQLRVIFGYEMLLQWQHHRQDKKREKLFEKERHYLKSRHEVELQRLERKAHRLRKLEIREAQTLNRLTKRLGNEGVDKNIRQEQRREEKSHGVSLSYI
ncbi:MAG: hypothetical protein DHS20C05_02590 [Hyphococcus sp.]|nr:MAG: hypothetical protein DHS20C05_02590 [Marinicaulis sp.]